MAMKPTPSKLVLLMSAAGLGLSWSGAALASRDNSAPASFVLKFGIAPRSEPACDAQAPDGWASCQPAHGELVRTIVAVTAALPLPFSAEVPASDVKAPLQAYGAYGTRPPRWPHEARASDGESEPSNEAPLAEVLVTPRITGGSSHDREFDAIAMVLLDDPQGVADAAAAGSELAGRLVTTAQRSLDPAVARESDASVRELVGEADLSPAQARAVDTAAATWNESPDGLLDVPAVHVQAGGKVAAVATATPVRAEPRPTDEGPAAAEFADGQASLPVVSGFQGADRSAGIARVSTSQDPTPSDSASIDRVLASLAEVLGSQLEESPRAIEKSELQTAAPKQAVALPATVARAAVDPAPLVSASSVDVARNDGKALKRSRAADDIVVVASHSDKILLSLAALRSGEGLEMGQLGAQAKKTVVVRHTDKVLETLTLFKSGKQPKRTALACTGASDEEAMVAAIPTRPQGAWELPEMTDKSAIADVGREPDILLDLLPPLANRPERPVLQAAPAQAKQPELPVAARSEGRAIGSELIALSAEKLDEVRGGFVTGDGLKISFGIERAVYLNGTLVTTTSLSIADLSKITGGQAQVAGNGTAGNLALLQSGAGNVFAPGSISSTAAGTVIQNTLDNQKISTITRIDAVVNSSGIMRSMNLQSSMQSAIVNSLRR